MRSPLKPIYELKLLNEGYDAIIGIDEAGRGPWAGPVSIVAYIFSLETVALNGVHDSKLVTPKNRRIIFEKFSKYPDQFIYSHKTSDTIDQLGIGKTIEQSISELVKKIQISLNGMKILFLIDGYFKSKFDCEYELIKSGDRKFYSIAAASIIAKVTRDDIMHYYAKKYPEYGFEKHVGYGTKYHRIQLLKHGPCPIHRRSFKPVAELI